MLGRGLQHHVARRQHNTEKAMLFRLFARRIARHNVLSSSSSSLTITRSFASIIPTTKNNNGNGRRVIEIHESVRQALHEHRPVVALESTLVAHGMPYPQNLELSLDVATILRDAGVEPATIAVKNGVCRVGLSVKELEDLARAKEQQEGRTVQKCSTRELSLIMAQHKENQNVLQEKDQWGATTVASTMVVAHAAGIPTFVTGGIGGVHRHGEVSMDVSADLTELSRTPVIVVSAGIKSILDISRTLEVLETNGVPTVAYGTDEFPAFFSPHSGVAAPARMDSADTIAAAYWAARDLSQSHGMLVAVPNNDTAGQHVEDAIQAALVEAQELNIEGAAVTPFVLQLVAKLTEGESLRSNMSLVKQNAQVGADIAIAVAEQRRDRENSWTSSGVMSFGAKTTKTASAGDNPREDEDSIKPHHHHEQHKSRVVVMGGIVMDLVARPETGRALLTKTSNPATCTESDGGVGRNMAEVLGRLGSRPLLYSAVGSDIRGKVILDRLETECGVHTIPNVVDGANTATYLAVLDGDGDLHTACADMSVLSSIASPPDEVLEAADILVVDANPPLDVLADTLRRAHHLGADVFLEPTSVPKAIEFAKHSDELLSYLTFASPNVDELLALADGWSSSPEDVLLLLEEDGFPTTRAIASRVLERMNCHPEQADSTSTMAAGAAHLLITMGEKGVLLASKTPMPDPDSDSSSVISFEHFEAYENVKVANATGAGDAFAGAFVHVILRDTKTGDQYSQRTISKAVKAGMGAAVLTLQCSDRTISPHIASDAK